VTAGDIVKGQLLVVESFTVKASEDIEFGEVVYSDGNGILAAPNTATGPFMVALESHDYSEESSHEIECLLAGCVEVQKKTGTAIKKGQAVMVSSDAGEVTLWAKGDAPAGGASQYYDSTIEAGVQTALDTNIRRVGVAQADAASDDTTVKVWMGVAQG
jgi:predicted RecA/RadA family phage recombinase